MNKLVILFATVISSLIISCNATEEKEIELDNDNVVTTDNDNQLTNIDTTNVRNFNEVDTFDLADDDTVQTKEPVMVENEDGTIKQIEDEKVKDSTPDKEPEVKKEHVKKFYIVAGSFQEMENAVRLRAFFKSKNYPALILYPYNNYNRVAVGTYNTRAAAEKDIKKFRDMKINFENKVVEYWLLWR